jgi:hypothetical protein
MQNSWQWQQATGKDVGAMVLMAQQHFQTEIDQIFRPDPVAYERNLMKAIVEQFYNAGQELVLVAQHNQQLQGYVWAHRSTAPWSDDAMCTVRMVHVNLNLPSRQRVRMITEMIMAWELWAMTWKMPVICSTSMRQDWQTFMALHQRRGYSVRGSFAYRRLDISQSAVKHP